MAYENIYTSSFDDLGGTVIEVAIKEENFPSSSERITLDGSKGVEIQYNLKGRVYSTAAIVNIVNDFDDKFEFAKMMAEPYETYKLEVKKNSIIYFEGFLLPQTFAQNVRHRSLIALTFSNGLTMLENVIPSFLTDGTESYWKEIDILDNILSYLNLGYDLYLNNSLFENSMGGAVINPLEESYVSRYVFQKNNGDWDNALEILNKILKSINAYCYIKKERIVIERFVDKATNPKPFVLHEIDSSSGAADSEVGEGFTETNLDSLILDTDRIRYQVDPPIKTLKVRLNAKKFVNILDNDFDRNVEDEASPYTFHYWSYNLYTYVIDTNFSNSFISRGVNITRHAALHTWSQFLGNAYLIYKGELTNKNDLVILSLGFNAWKAVSYGDDIDFRYKVRLISQADGTTRYINASGALQAGSYAFHDVQTNSKSSGYRYDFEITNEFDLSGLLNAEGLTGDLFVEVEVRPPDMTQDDVDVIYGDFLLTQEDTRINNLLEAALNNDAFKTVEEELDLYDTGFINYLAQKVLSDASGYKITDSWSDDFNASQTLQQHYILNRGNLLNASSPVLHVVVNDRTTDIFIDNIFYTALLKDDLNNNMKFYIDEFRYNMRQHTYTLTLKKWLATVGKSIV